MASYPPPPPGRPGATPPGPGYGPVDNPGGFAPGYAPGSAYDRRAWRAQRRAAKIQARWMRQQYRMQRRSLRRGSIVGPLVLLTLGVIFLLEQTGRLSWVYSFEWYARWWPAVLIVAGVILLLEWLFDQQRAEEMGRPIASHVLSGGAVFLLILLAIVGLSARWTDSAASWHNHTWLGHDLGGLDRVFGEAHESDESLNYALPQGGMLVVHDPWGAVTVTGSSDDGQVHVSVHKQVYAWGDSDADKRSRQLQPTFSTQGNNLMLDVPAVNEGQADLTIEMPHAADLSVSSDHGDVRVNELHGSVTIASRKGDVDVAGIDGPVLAQVNNDDSSVSAKSVTGAFTLQGRAGDISLENIDGAVMLQGDFFGTTEAQQINGPLRFETSRTKFATARVDGNLEIESGDLNGERLLGPVTIATRNRTIELDDVSGPVTISNKNGAVSLTSAEPLGPVNVTNEHGSIDLGLPDHANFVLNAETRNGELENDFGLESQSENDRHWLTGTVGSGGTRVRIETSDGDVTVRKSVAAPLPPTAPTPPKLTVAPESPVAPATPTSPKAAKKAHKAKPAAQSSPAPAAPTGF